MLKKLKNLIKANTKVPETSTLEKINDHLWKTVNKPRPKSKPGLSPSALGAKCLRKVYYGYWKVEKDFPVNDRAARIFATGDAIEELFMGWLKAIGEHIPYRTKAGRLAKDPQFPIKSKRWEIRKGYIDNIAFSKGKLWIHEIKSSNDKKFKALTEPEPAHKVQATVYLTTFNEMLKAGEFQHIPELRGVTDPAVGIKYFYLNKNTSEVKEFVIYGEQLGQYEQLVTARVQEIQKHNREKKLPKKTEDYCFFCPYKVKCKRDFNDIL